MTLSLSDATGKQTSSLVVETFHWRHGMTTAVECYGRIRRLSYGYTDNATAHEISLRLISITTDWRWLRLVQLVYGHIWNKSTVMILSFRTDMPGQTVQTQIRLLRSSLIRVYTVCHSVCIVSTHYSRVEPHSSNFRVITTNLVGVQIFRKFMVSSQISHR